MTDVVEVVAVWAVLEPAVSAQEIDAGSAERDAVVEQLEVLRAEQGAALPERFAAVSPKHFAAEVAQVLAVEGLELADAAQAVVVAVQVVEGAAQVVEDVEQVEVAERTAAVAVQAVEGVAQVEVAAVAAEQVVAVAGRAVEGVALVEAVQAAEGVEQVEVAAVAVEQVLLVLVVERALAVEHFAAVPRHCHCAVLGELRVSAAAAQVVAGPTSWLAVAVLPAPGASVPTCASKRF